MSRYLVIALLLLPQLAAARVYMCVDEATGVTSFTDKACDTAASGEEVRLNQINPGTSGPKTRNTKRQVWRSDMDARKTGSDYNAQRKALYENKATAATN